MGKVRIPIGQSEVTIGRSIARESVKEVMRKTGFDPKAKILFRDRLGVPPSPKSMFKSCYTEGALTAYRNLVIVEYEENFTEAGLMKARYRSNDVLPIFHDEELGIKLTPEYAESLMVVKMKFRGNSLAKLNAWINALRLTEGLQNLLYEVDARYDFSIPYPYLQFLHHAHDLREKDPILGYGDDLRTYLLTHFRQGIQTRKNAKNGDDAHREVIFHEVHRNTTGRANEELFYNAKEIDSGIYEVDLELSFRYPKIIGLTMEYPAIIHNSFIDMAFPNAFHTRSQDDGQHLKPLSYIGGILNVPSKDYIYCGDGGSRLIEWDEWFPKDPIEATQTVSIFPISVDQNDLTGMFNVYDLDDSYLPAACKAYLAKYHDDFGKSRHGLVSIELYSVGAEEEIRYVNLDAALNATSRVDMDGRKRNYVRIGLFKDIALTNPVTLRKLLKDEAIMKPLMELYDPTVTFTDDITVWESRMPTEIVPGRNPRIPSLIYSTAENGIDDRSFTLWLKKLKATNEWFIGLNSNTAYQIAANNLTVKRNGSI